VADFTPQRGPLSLAPHRGTSWCGAGGMAGQVPLCVLSWPRQPPGGLQRCRGPSTCPPRPARSLCVAHQAARRGGQGERNAPVERHWRDPSPAYLLECRPPEEASSKCPKLPLRISGGGSAKAVTIRCLIKKGKPKNAKTHTLSWPGHMPRQLSLGTVPKLAHPCSKN